MIPKWLYNFNHYLMLVSLGLYLLITVSGLITMPFMKSFSRRFIEWLSRFYGWALPCLLAIVVLSSAVVLCGFSKHRIELKKEDKD